MYLKRYHDVTISKSGVWRILNRLDMGRLPASQRYKRHDRRWKRYEKQLPGHRVQIDVKFIEPLTSMPQGRRGGRNKYFQFTAIDDRTRLRVLRIYPTLNQATAIQFVDYVIQRLPFQVKVIQTDNGAEFQTAFHWHVLDKGIARTYIKPRTPRLNGKVERSHRIGTEEFYRLVSSGRPPTESASQRVSTWVRHLHHEAQVTAADHERLWRRARRPTPAGHQRVETGYHRGDCIPSRRVVVMHEADVVDLVAQGLRRGDQVREASPRRSREQGAPELDGLSSDAARARSV
ncbi:hypothetical protein ACFYXF_47135 [Streptomyces sp. NPDC002680]|uniref:hypothetical protein n=1 Tax=Streptomyces sp. NPDC002680 TaxID=3364659 RepID=UPI00368F009A